MKKVLFIVGPTAVGKTSLALNIAKKTSGELINADSVQVYKGLDIISGKDIPKNFEKLNSSIFFKGRQLKSYLFESIPVHLLDSVEASYSFNLYDFVNISQAIVKDVWSRNKLPIVVGGNGFYLNSFFNKIPTINIPPNPSLRKKLDQVSVEELKIILEKINPRKFASMNNSDRNNKRRLVRAIEVVKDKEVREDIQNLKFDSIIIGLKTSKELISKLIEKRIDVRLEKGALKEAEDLLKSFDNLSPQVKNAIGYKELFAHFRGEISMEVAVRKWKNSELVYVKKQLTWFKKNKSIIWVDPTKRVKMQKIESEVLEWYNQT